MNSPEWQFTMFPLWWSIKPDFSPLSTSEKEAIDKSTHQFIPTVRAMNEEKELPPVWRDLEGNFGKLILCDQIARNAFRGT